MNSKTSQVWTKPVESRNFEVEVEKFTGKLCYIKEHCVALLMVTCFGWCFHMKCSMDLQSCRRVRKKIDFCLLWCCHQIRTTNMKGQKKSFWLAFKRSCSGIFHSFYWIFYPNQIQNKVSQPLNSCFILDGHSKHCNL